MVLISLVSWTFRSAVKVLMVFSTLGTVAKKTFLGLSLA